MFYFVQIRQMHAAADLLLTLLQAADAVDTLE